MKSTRPFVKGIAKMANEAADPRTQKTQSVFLETQRNPEKPQKAQSDTDTDTDTDTKNNTISSERSKDHSRTDGNKAKIAFNWETESFENISKKQFEIWSKTYPAVDIQSETLKAAAWQAANPTKRKKDYKKFLNSWFARQQGTRRNLKTLNLKIKGRNIMESKTEIIQVICDSCGEKYTVELQPETNNGDDISQLMNQFTRSMQQRMIDRKKCDDCIEQEEVAELERQRQIELAERLRAIPFSYGF